jgi:hypothetical protein
MDEEQASRVLATPLGIRAKHTTAAQPPSTFWLVYWLEGERALPSG